MFEKVRKLISEQLAVDEEKIIPESRIKEDLGADSLDVLQMLMTLEEDYGIEIPDEELAEFKTVQDIVGYCDGKIEL
jgi:acyl carrier protein